MNERMENIRYCALLAFHTMLTCPSVSFATAYLTEEGVSARETGIIIAIGCILATIMQQLIGRLVDKNLIAGRKLLLALSLVVTIVGFSVEQFGTTAKMIAFGGALCIIMGIMPLLYSFSFYYKEKNISINYGIARGCGSLSYCGISLILGFLCVDKGLFVVPMTLGVLGAGLFVILLSMPSLSGAPKKESDHENKNDSLKLSMFPAFRLMIIGSILVMLFHNMSMTYIVYIIENVGGNSIQLGIALGLAAVLELPILFMYTRIKGNKPSKYFLTASGIGFFIKASLLIAAQSVWMIYLVQCLQIISFGLMAAARVYYVDEIVGDKYESTGQAYMSATDTLGLVLGSIIGGFLMEDFGIEGVLWSGAGFTFLGMLLMITSCKMNK